MTVTDSCITKKTIYNQNASDWFVSLKILERRYAQHNIMYFINSYSAKPQYKS